MGLHCEKGEDDEGEEEKSGADGGLNVTVCAQEESTVTTGCQRL